jgi:hypothetical protein
VIETRAHLGVNTSGALVVVLASGARVESTDNWTFVPQGSITTVDPAIGQAGSVVTIAGVGEPFSGNFADIQTVALAGVLAESVHDTNGDPVVVVTAAASSEAKRGDVVVVTASGAITTGTDRWQYVAPGNVTSISPSFGQHGTRVVIKGTGLLGTGSVLVSATLAGEEVANITAYNDTEVELVAPVSTAALEGVVVLTSETGVRVTSTLTWAFLLPGQISSVAPATGQKDTRVFISGARLRGYGTAVVQATLAGVAARIERQTDSFVEVVADEGPLGLVGAVTLVADTGAIVTKVDAWTYVATGNITEVRPSSGVLGTVVELHGTALLSGGSSVTSVTLAGVDATILSGNDTLVKLVAKTSPKTVGDVVITSDSAATTTLVDGWEYLQLPTIHQVTSVTSLVFTLLAPFL